ncbi:hypothetical protein VTN00DRAFT_10047 [Thermoascus crustaceus]|uniref:uncharacterized protein n=1 Tax=Thermoascus crustaceus TaxID=5088 RepID=UPI003742B699
MATTAESQPSGMQTVSALLENITSCLSTAGSSLPKTHKDAPSDVSIEPPQDGISLLDTKSDLLLSYLHNLVFLILFQLHELSSSKTGSTEDGKDAGDSASLRDDIVKKLAELRIYLDRGVRPLEGRLKYQVDKVVKAAEDAERAQRSAEAAKKSKDKKKASSDDEDDEEEGSDASESGSSDEESDEEEIDEMAYRPNISAFSKAVAPTEKKSRSDSKSDSKKSTDGIYRPPKIKPTALPTTDHREREERRPKRSNVIDEFVTAEMSSAPMAEPSIGSTIRQGGRHVKTQRERERDEERREYEETNFVRLQESKKDKAKRRREMGRDGGFGGEDFRLLGEGADRITRLTRRAQGSGSVLERSRKRKLTEDGPRGDGVSIGETFEKRRKKIDSWKKK